jgi:hypothetical protein
MVSFHIYGFFVTWFQVLDSLKSSIYSEVLDPSEVFSDTAIKTPAWRQAVQTTVAYNKLLIQEKRVRGPYYFEPHTETIQVHDSWTVNAFNPTPTLQQLEKEKTEFFIYLEDKRKSDTPNAINIGPPQQIYPPPPVHSVLQSPFLSSPSPFVEQMWVNFIR